MSKCRIMYSIPEASGNQYSLYSLIRKGLKITAIAVGCFAFTIYIWAAMWFLCALDDVCYAANVGV